MGQCITVTLRGAPLPIEITHDGSWEPDTGAHEIEWVPVDISVDEYNAMSVTAEEENAIYDQIYSQLEDQRFSDDVI